MGSGERPEDLSAKLRRQGRQLRPRRRREMVALPSPRQYRTSVPGPCRGGLDVDLGPERCRSRCQTGSGWHATQIPSRIERSVR